MVDLAARSSKYLGVLSGCIALVVCMLYFGRSEAQKRQSTTTSCRGFSDLRDSYPAWLS
jgi:hypothetical protein